VAEGSKGREFESTPRTSVVSDLSYANRYILVWTKRKTIQWSQFGLKPKLIKKIGPLLSEADLKYVGQLP